MAGIGTKLQSAKVVARAAAEVVVVRTVAAAEVVVVRIVEAAVVGVAAGAVGSDGERRRGSRAVLTANARAERPRGEGRIREISHIAVRPVDHAPTVPRAVVTTLRAVRPASGGDVDGKT